MDPIAHRLVLPELLDTLPHNHPDAIRSRLELELINRLMGNHRWLVRQLKSQGTSRGRVLELGAGDGGLRKAAADAVMPDQWMALDRVPPPEDWPEAAPWFQTDLFQLQTLPDAEVVVANLFLHHFEKEALAWIGNRIPAGCRLFLASEPARYRIHHLQGRILSWLAGLSAVTQHDMERSIQAGFRGAELSDWLGLSGWQVQIHCTALGAYRIRAWR
jgi:hypothetical protein